MPAYKVHLFGKLSIELETGDVIRIESRKVQELFCFLLLHGERSHPREVLANLLWQDVTAAATHTVRSRTAISADLTGELFLPR